MGIPHTIKYMTFSFIKPGIHVIGAMDNAQYELLNQ